MPKPTEPESLPPRVLIVMPDQWRRALLRAALREVGYDAVGTSAVPTALRIAPHESHRGSVRLILLDQSVLRDARGGLFDRLVTLHGNPPTILLARAMVSPPPGSWRRVLPRPISVEDVVREVETLLPLSVDRKRSLD